MHIVSIRIDASNKKHIAISNSIAQRSQHDRSFPDGRLQTACYVTIHNNHYSTEARLKKKKKKEQRS